MKEKEPTVWHSFRSFGNWWFRKCKKAVDAYKAVQSSHGMSKKQIQRMMTDNTEIGSDVDNKKQPYYTDTH